MTSKQLIPLSAIRLDGGTQPRAALNSSAVEDYTEAMGAGAEIPPVTVFYDGADYWLADGFRRVKSARAADHETIECEVHQGRLEDAQWYSFSANRTNGLRRTTSDKQRAVRSAITHPRGAGLSNRQIAAHVGVDESTVRVWREKLTAGIPQSTKRKGRDGRTIAVTKIGRAAILKADAAPSSEATSDPGAPNPTSSASARTTRAQKIERATRLTLSFFDATKHFAHLINWLGETAGEFEEAERLMAETMSAIAAVSAEIERKAIEVDPLNRDRLEIKEKRS